MVPAHSHNKLAAAVAKTPELLRKQEGVLQDLVLEQ